MEAIKRFTNGFTSWMETHHEIVSYITLELHEDDIAETVIGEVYNDKGLGGMYELSEDWTDEFEELNTGRNWDGEFFDELTKFCENKNHNNN